MFPTGNFKCVFSEGSVRHTAQRGLAVALLPDTIEMRSSPLSADCVGKEKSESVAVTVTAIILNSTEKFNVSWLYRDKVCKKGYLKPDGKKITSLHLSPRLCSIWLGNERTSEGMNEGMRELTCSLVPYCLHNDHYSTLFREQV